LRESLLLLLRLRLRLLLLLLWRIVIEQAGVIEAG